MCLNILDPAIGQKLLPFQKEGVCFGVEKQGRVLIGDEMGLGKTYQALAIMDYYRNDWPLLICTTSSTKDQWAQKVSEIQNDM
jgi:SWI/SNF-related matrix-associated actin-dependent regulator 1 of chromatin subfamily A